VTTASSPITASAAKLHWPAILFVLLTVVVLGGALLVPTYTNYDSTYSLIWGREILSGQLPGFAVYRAPTEHPLGLLFGVFFALFGRAGDRIMVFATLCSFLVLVAGFYQLGRRAFTPLVGLAAAAIIVTRFNFPLLAARAYIDIPYIALVVWAAALEVSKSRRGTSVLVILAFAGLLRPEAWILSGLYWLWLFPALSWRQRIGNAALVLVAPLIWVGLDYFVTGDPLFSQSHTSDLAEELGRQQGAGQVPSALVGFLSELLSAPLAFAGLLGIALAGWLVPTRIRVPLALFIVGLATFLLLGVGGFSVVKRYLLAPSMMLMVFAGFTLAGFSVLQPGRMRMLWVGASSLGILLAIVITLRTVDVGRVFSVVSFRGDSERALAALLDQPGVRRVAECGSVLTSNHRLVPDVRWIMDLPADRVVARSDVAAASKVSSGIAVLAANATVFLRDGLNPDGTSAEEALQNIPPTGYRPIAANDLYAVYGRCR